MPQSAPLRRDAERNRQRILTAARQLMRTRGLDVSHDEIADEAEVGVGTVYRRFPDRVSLIDAVFEDHIRQLVDLADAATRQAAGWAALERFMEASLELQASDRGLSELLRGHAQSSRLAVGAREAVEPRVELMLEQARTAGELPDDVTPGDLVIAHLMVCGVMDAAPLSPQLPWRRALHIALQGLRHHPDPLPPPVPDGAIIEQLQGGQHQSKQHT